MSYGTNTAGGDGVVRLSWTAGAASDPPTVMPAPQDRIDDTIVTGCLERGRLRALDLGEGPLRPCRSHETQIMIPVMEVDEATQSSPGQ